MATNVKVDMRPAPLFFTDVYRRGGDVDGNILRRAERVASVGKATAPVRTGRLAASIKVDRNRNRVGQYDFGYRVKPTVFYAAWALDPSATHPHEILGSPFLEFPGLGGELIYRRKVMHPGTRNRNDFMLRALQAAR